MKRHRDGNDRVEVGGFACGLVVVAAGLVAGSACSQATQPSPAPTEVSATSAALTGTPSTCLPGHYVMDVDKNTAACPVPTNPTGWRVLKHQAAVARLLREPTPDQPPGVTVTGTRCSYVWLGDAEPAGAPTFASKKIVAHQLCIDEPPPPDDLLASTCPAGVQIGVRPGDLAVCPPARGWRVEPLFPGKDGELGRYCRYSATRIDDSHEVPVELIPATAPTGTLPPWVRADCAAVASLAIPSDRAAMEQSYADAVESVAHLPAPAGGTPPGRVRVAVVDTALDEQDNGLPGVGRDPHGRAMGALIARLACPERASDPTALCAADVRTVPALWLESHPDGYVRDPRGGYFGMQTDLARAIVDAVDTTPPGDRTAINLSVGWSKLFGGGEANPAAFPPAVRAVYNALEYARCRDAVIVVAAGNATGTPLTPVGPLIPGAWETRTAPSADRCRDDLGVNDAPADAGEGALVIAAGGVDLVDHPLFNTPLLGRPRLAAPAQAAIVADPAPPKAQTSAGFTGSSAAAATVSAAVAITLSYRPGLTATDVANLVYQQGVDLHERASFCLGGGPCDFIHRVSICRTAVAACGGAATCPVNPPCPTDGARSTPADSPDYAALPQDPCAGPTPDPACPPAGPSGQPTALYNTWPLPAVNPQPTIPPCTVCGLTLPTWWLNLVSNHVVGDPGYYFQAAQLNLFTSTGSLSLFVDGATDPTLYLLQGVDGDTRAGLVNLSLMSGTTTSASVTLRVWDWDYWGAVWKAPVYETDVLYLSP